MAWEEADPREGGAWGAGTALRVSPAGRGGCSLCSSPPGALGAPRAPDPRGWRDVWDVEDPLRAEAPPNGSGAR